MNQKPEGNENLITPMGSGERTIRKGDTLEKIARATGHLVETIKEAAANAEIFGERTTPEVMLPGDRLTIPPTRSKQLDAATGSCHTFVRATCAAPRLKLVLCLNHEPRADVSYSIAIRGSENIEGVTDSAGALDEELPLGTTRVLLQLGDDLDRYELQIGQLDPLKTIRGVAQRLANLGYNSDPAENGSEPSKRLQSAIEHFLLDVSKDPQSKPNTEINGDLLDQLKKKHGS